MTERGALQSEPQPLPPGHRALLLSENLGRGRDKAAKLGVKSEFQGPANLSSNGSTLREPLHTISTEEW